MSIPEESIDLVARYLFSRDAAQSGVLRAWDQIPEASRRHYRTDAELALEHAAPYIAAQALGDFENYLRAGLNSAHDGGERHLHEDALIMLDAYRAQK